jgi:peptidoglycan-associated lipoprotein
MSFIKHCFLIALISCLAACSSTKLEDKSSSVVPLTVGSSTAKYDPISDPKSPLYQKGSIYFDIEENGVKSNYQSLLKSHSEYLKSSNARVFLEGNTDDRGTAEYNLALGQRRSEAVKKALTSLGVSNSQIEAVSFGKEKPKDSVTGEKAWRENRRVDIVYR